MSSEKSSTIWILCWVGFSWTFCIVSSTFLETCSFSLSTLLLLLDVNIDLLRLCLGFLDSFTEPTSDLLSIWLFLSMFMHDLRGLIYSALSSKVSAQKLLCRCSRFEGELLPKYSFLNACYLLICSSFWSLICLPPSCLLNVHKFGYINLFCKQVTSEFVLLCSSQSTASNYFPNADFFENALESSN